MIPGFVNFIPLIQDKSDFENDLIEILFESYYNIRDVDSSENNHGVLTKLKYVDLLRLEEVTE